MKKIFLYLLSGAAMLNAAAQSPLTRSEAVRLTENSRKIALADNELQSAEAKFKQTDAVFLPQLTLDYSGMITNNPLNAFGFKLQQRSISQTDFAPELLNHPDATGNFATQAMLRQPIFNADMLAMRAAARKQITIAGYQKQRTIDYLKFSAATEYAQLQLSYEMEAVSREALATLQAIYKWTKDRYDQGYVQQSDLLNVSVQVKAAETQIATASSAIDEHCDNLSVLMGKPTGTIYLPDSLAADEVPVAATDIPAGRADFKAMETAISSYDDIIRSTKNSLIPSLNGFAAYQLNDAKPLGFSNGAYLAGFQVSWNVFKGNEVHTKTVSQKLAQKQLALQLQDSREQDQKALAKAHNQLKDADYQTTQYRAAMTQASEALFVMQNRYKQGLVSTTDILQAQSQLAQQKLYYKQAVMMHNVTLAYIHFLTIH